MRPILIETFSICWKFWHFQTIYSINRVGLWFPKATSLSFIFYFYLFHLDFCCVKLETKFWSKTWDGNKTKKWIRLNESGIALLIEDLKCLPQLTLLIFSWLFSIALLLVAVRCSTKDTDFSMRVGSLSEVCTKYILKGGQNLMYHFAIVGKSLHLILTTLYWD